MLQVIQSIQPVAGFGTRTDQPDRVLPTSLVQNLTGTAGNDTLNRYW